MTANKNAILFDLDGITIDTEPLYTRAEIRLFGEYGVKIPKKDLHLFRGCSEDKFFDLSMKRYGITESRDIFINRGRQYVIDEFNKKPSVDALKKIFYVMTSRSIKRLFLLRNKGHRRHAKLDDILPTDEDILKRASL